MKQLIAAALVVTALIVCSSGNKDEAPPGEETGGNTAEAGAPAKPEQKLKSLLEALFGGSKKSGGEQSSMPGTALEYARMCEPELGVPPRINLDECVEIPLYVNGVQKHGVFRRAEADNPNLQGKGFTSSGSVLQRYEGRTAEGKPLPDVIWIAFGRNEDWDGDQRKFTGSVQMIGYNRKTGATAFFESRFRNLNAWVRQDKGTLRMRGNMPWIDNPKEFNKAYIPAPMQCVSCHQADPFVTNPFIKAAKIPGTDKTVVPKLDKDSPYYVIGGENWDMRTMHIEGNSCFECHRVGMKTLELFLKSGWDPNKHMPPRKPGSLAEDYRELLAAWKNGPEKVEGAEWIIPPARGKDRQVVGDDYPYKAAFNQAGTEDKKAGPKSAILKDRNKEVEKLLKQLRDPQTRNGFAVWIKEHGLTEDTLEKLRSMAEGDDEKAEDKGESQDKKDWDGKKDPGNEALKRQLEALKRENEGLRKRLEERKDR